MWPEDAGQEVDVNDLSQRVLCGPKVEGITFLGGEPFAQAEALADLGARLRCAGLSVMTFTGYTLESITNCGNSDWMKLLSVTDLLVDGPYIHEKHDLSRPWVGSTNQRFHFLTNRYLHLKDSMGALRNRVEIRIGSNGELTLNGMFDTRNMHSFINAFGLAQIESAVVGDLR